MLWSINKNQGCPDAQQITQGVCSTYKLGNCNAPLPVPITPNCPPVSPSPPGPPTPPAPPSDCTAGTGTAVSGGACGATNGGKCCPGGECCSQWGYCGVGIAWCGAGCQAGYGSCSRPIF
jgi:hypothetical protein